MRNWVRSPRPHKNSGHSGGYLWSQHCGRETGRFPGQPTKSTGNQQASEGPYLKKTLTVLSDYSRGYALFCYVHKYTCINMCTAHIQYTYTHHLHIYPYIHQQRLTHREVVIKVAKEQRNQRKDTLREKQHRKTYTVLCWRDKGTGPRVTVQSSLVEVGTTRGLANLDHSKVVAIASDTKANTGEENPLFILPSLSNGQIHCLRIWAMIRSHRLMIRASPVGRKEQSWSWSKARKARSCT